MTLTIIEIIIILLLSAFFSGMEIAFVSSNKLRVELDRSDASLTSKILTIFYTRPNDFISTLLVGNNIALVVYGILMAGVINEFVLSPIHLNQHEGLNVALQTIISTLIVLVTGEFLPKTLFKINPNRMLKIFAVPAFIIYILLYPVSKFTSALSRGILRLMGLKVNKKASEQALGLARLHARLRRASHHLRIRGRRLVEARMGRLARLSPLALEALERLRRLLEAPEPPLCERRNPRGRSGDKKRL